MSWYVSTAATPGSARARLASILLIMACATGDHPTVAWSNPRISVSSVTAGLPCTNLSASTLISALPTSFVFAGRSALVEQRLRRQDQSPRAIAALDRARFDKRLLQRVQWLTALPATPLLAADSLDRGDMPAGDLGCKGHTGVYRRAVYQHQARAARAVFAPM